MKMRTLLILALSLLLPCGAWGQSSLKRQFQKVASIFKSPYDTNYVRPNPYKWMFKLNLNIHGSDLNVRGVENGEKQRIDTWAQHKRTVSISAAYKGIGASLSLNPGKWFGRYSDLEFNVNTYVNRIGLDATYTNVGTYTGNASFGDTNVDIQKGMMKQKTLNVNTYYVVNYKHYSYPASLSQSQRQIKSCGSWLIGGSYIKGSYNFDFENDLVEDIKIRLNEFSVGAGYGYNYVSPRHGWLIHISSVPQVVVISKNKQLDENGNVLSSHRFPNWVTFNRLAVTRNWGNNFINIAATLFTNSTGRTNKFWFLYSKWSVKFTYGFRLL